MARVKGTGAVQGSEVSEEQRRRQTQPFIERLGESLCHTTMARLAILGLTATPAFFALAAQEFAAMPMATAFAAGALIVWPLIGWSYLTWLKDQRFELPYRAPMSWAGIDWSHGPKSTQRGSGILHLGQTVDTNEWVSLNDSDGRTHLFTLGTTGSGKALTALTLILTPFGWVRNGDLRPGSLVIKPNGEVGTVTSIHPQGRRNLFRVHFEDGRCLDGDSDHLWKIWMGPAGGKPDWSAATEEGQFERRSNLVVDGPSVRLLTSADLGFLTGANEEGILPGQIDVCVPLAAPVNGIVEEGLTEDLGRRAADQGLAENIGGPIECLGQVAQRRAFVSGYFSGRPTAVRDGFLQVGCADVRDARLLRGMIWSLGGIAFVLEVDNLDAPIQGITVMMRVPGAAELAPGTPGIDDLEDPVGLRVLSVEPLPESEAEDCTCIKVDDTEGLYVAENFIVTHNTEFIYGLVFQSLSWASGFLFVDGKGTSELYFKVVTLAARYGRTDDLRVLNFMNSTVDKDAPAGGMISRTNTTNPFQNSSADELKNLISSMMGKGPSGGGDFWRNRAESLVSSAVSVLVEMRDRGEVLLDAQTFRSYIALGVGVRKKEQAPAAGGFGAGRRGARDDSGYTDVSQITEEDWEAIREKSGMIELYLRALNGEFSNATRINLQGFFDSLTDFSLSKALQGTEQQSKTAEQYSYMTMQLTQPLGLLADSFGHIFRTTHGDVEMNDIVLSRRILVVLLPTLQKSTQETQNVGTVIVSMVKGMMGANAGSDMEGKRKVLLDCSSTRSQVPFIAVFDEVGYYMVEGMDAMSAQGRSLGFCLIFGAQDLQKLRQNSREAADAVLSNVNVLATGKTVDAGETWTYIESKVGQETVAETTGAEFKSGLFSGSYTASNNIQYKEQKRLKIQDVQKLSAGEFYFVLGGRLIKSRTFYVAMPFVESFPVNRFLKVWGPTDTAPGYDSAPHRKFQKDMEGAAHQLELYVVAAENADAETVDGEAKTLIDEGNAPRDIFRVQGDVMRMIANSGALGDDGDPEDGTLEFLSLALLSVTPTDHGGLRRPPIDADVDDDLSAAFSEAGFDDIDDDEEDGDDGGIDPAIGGFERRRDENTFFNEPVRPGFAIEEPPTPMKPNLHQLVDRKASERKRVAAEAQIMDQTHQDVPLPVQRAYATPEAPGDGWEPIQREWEQDYRRQRKAGQSMQKEGTTLLEHVQVAKTDDYDQIDEMMGVMASEDEKRLRRNMSSLIPEGLPSFNQRSSQEVLAMINRAHDAATQVDQVSEEVR